MTDDLQKQLVAMAKEIHTQNNRITHEPIFMVQRHRRTYGFDPSYTDNPVYLTQDDHDEVDPERVPKCPKCAVVYTKAQTDETEQSFSEGCPACKVELTEDEQKKIKRISDDCLRCPKCEEPLNKDDLDDENCHSCDESFDLGEDLYLYKTAFQDTWENVQPFFTEKGAEEYLRINGHNIRGREEPRIYVESAFRNAEWQAIREMLARLNLSEELVDEVIAEEQAAKAAKENA
jgi:uncharacterized C2H2 Zn-finger protein